MSLVGFDPEQVLALRLAMRRAADELLAMRSTDPLAAGPLANVAAARRALVEHWEPVLQRVLATGALTDTAWLGGPAATGIDPGAFDLVLAELGLAMGDPAVMRLDDWHTLATTLGAERMDVAQQLVDDPENADLRRRLADLDEALIVVAQRYASGPHDGHVPWRPMLLDTVDPYTAALLLPGLGLGDHQLGVEAARLLGRERDEGPDGMPWPDMFAGGDDTGDLVFELLAAHPYAAGVFLDLAVARPEILFRTAERDETVAAVLIAGTDPADVDAATAGARLRPLLDWAMEFGSLQGGGDGITEALPLVLAGAVGPWLLQFGPRADEWGWDTDAADEALRWVVADDLAVDAVVASMAAWRDSMGTQPLLLPDGRLDLDLLDDLTAMVDQVGRAVRDAGLDDAAASRFLAEAGVFVAALFVSAVVPGGIVVSMAADAALAVAVPAGVSALAGWGVLPSADADRADARAGFGQWSTDAAVAAVISVATQAIADGRMPADALDDLDLDDLAVAASDGDCPTGEVFERLQQWVLDVAPRCDPATANALSAALTAFANHQTVGQACDR
jgi:hypothetical protein